MLRAEWEPLLSDHERASLKRLELARDQRDFVAAHALLRLGAREVGAPDPPRAADRPAWSLDHTDGLVASAFALSPGVAVGVDAEPVASGARLVSMAGMFTTEMERAWLAAEPARRNELLVVIWAVKEAALKARCLGVTTESGYGVMRTVECSAGETLDGWETIAVSEVGRDVRYRAWTRGLGGHVLSVVVRGREEVVRAWRGYLSDAPCNPVRAGTDISGTATDIVRG